MALFFPDYYPGSIKKVAICEGFYWGMSKISKGGMPKRANQI